MPGLVAQAVPDLIPQRCVVPTGSREKDMAFNVIGTFERLIEEVLD
jgi:hypothetical protein